MSLRAASALLTIALVALFATGTADARRSDRNQPMDIDAGHQSGALDDSAPIILSGGVVITQGTMRVEANGAEITTRGGDIQRAARVALTQGHHPGQGACAIGPRARAADDVDAFERIGRQLRPDHPAAERIVQTHSDRSSNLKPDEAFVCGLLHDIGKIALDMILPRALYKVVQLAERRCESLTNIEKSLIGIDHTMVGKRLAEKWGLSEMIRDVIWLHGRPARSIPDLPHKQIVGVVSAANDLARLMHVGFSGNSAPPRALGMA